MKILALAGLSSRLVESQFSPLTKLKKVEQIFVIRTSQGPRLAKLQYFSPPGLLKKLRSIDLVYKMLLTLKLTSKHKPDLISSFYLVPHGLIAFLGAKIIGKPVTQSLIGTDLNVHCKRRVIGKLLLWVIRNSDIVTVPGSISRQFLIDYGVDKTKIVILPNTVDQVRFKPQEVNKKYDIITIGRLVGVKHIEILLEIITKLKKFRKDIKVGIAGSGPLKTELEQLATNLNLQNNVEFLGFVEDASLFLNSGKVYVLTSESEGLPTAMVEAMACAVPCVVSKVGNIPDVVTNGKNGVIIDDYRDVEGYVKAITKLLKDQDHYKKLSKNALDIREKYSVENATQTWKKIIAKLQLS
jgi:glycosyltransferase involved in cell wall biosynthesis